MQKLVVACSAVLGVSVGSQAFAEVSCYKYINWDRCQVIDDTADFSGRHSFTVNGLRAEVTVSDASIIGVEMTDSSFKATRTKVDSLSVRNSDVTFNSGMLGEFGISAASNAVFKNVAIDHFQNREYGMGSAVSDSTFFMDGGRITTNMGVRLIHSHVTLNNVDVIDHDEVRWGSSLWQYHKNGHLNIYGGRIDSRLSSAISIDEGTLELDGTRITSEKIGILGGASGWPSSEPKFPVALNVRNFEINTKQDGASGVHALGGGAGTSASLLNGRIQTQGEKSYGVYVAGGIWDEPLTAVLDASGVDIFTHGKSAHGVTSSSALVTLDRVNIRVNGASSVGLLGSGRGSTFMNGGEIRATGDGSYGVRTDPHGWLDHRQEVDLSGVNIFTEADNSDAMYINSQGDGSFKNGNIHAAGRGVTVGDSTSLVKSASVNIVNSNIFSESHALTNYGGDARLAEVNIKVNTGDGLVAGYHNKYGNAWHATVNAANITVNGEGAYGVRAHGYQNESLPMLNLNGVSITARARNSDAMYLDGYTNAAFKNGQINSAGRGVTARHEARVGIDNSNIQANLYALGFLGPHYSFRGSTITLDDSMAVSVNSAGVLADNYYFYKTDQLNLINSTLAGNRLADVHSRLELNANNGRLYGNTALEQTLAGC